MSGIEILVQAKADYLKDGKQDLFPKVIMLTSIDDIRLKNRVLKDKLVDHFMMKPLTTQVL
jgi:FixJ family two-component response regulator